MVVFYISFDLGWHTLYPRYELYDERKDWDESLGQLLQPKTHLQHLYKADTEVNICHITQDE